MPEPLPLSAADQVRHDACPVCGSGETAPFRHSAYQGSPVRHERCVRCSLVFLNPRPTQAWYDRFFAERYWEDKAEKWNIDARANVRQWRKQLVRAERYIAFLSAAGLAPAAGTNHLDIGCAYGLIARTLADRYGGIACGIEPSHVARRFAADESGVEIIAETSAGLAAWHPEVPVGLVVFSHVLEYIADPNDVFAAVRRLIAPDGLVLVETPNIYLMRAAHIHHPYCYSKRSLGVLLRRHGFAPAAIEPAGPLKTALSSGFFTAAARLAANAEAARADGQMAPAPRAGLGMNVGQAWFRLANRFPLNRLGGLLNGHRRGLSPASRQRLADLVSRTNEPAGEAARLTGDDSS